MDKKEQINNEQFITDMAKRVALFGSEVSVERINEIMSESSVPGSTVYVTREEAAACGIDSLSTSEVREIFGDDLDNLSDEDAYYGVQTEEFKSYTEELTKGLKKKGKRK